MSISSLDLPFSDLILYQKEKVVSPLGTHQLILTGGGGDLYGAGILFLKFFNKPIQRESDSGGQKYFF